MRIEWKAISLIKISSDPRYRHESVGFESSDRESHVDFLLEGGVDGGNV